ncbi:MAG: Sau3AI family type II restriction endonuclease [Erysipelotrichaceae bacterium]|nr:Sau3AI family type II restriction endonuclease [Erysipelotrichaceae bacterium]
MTNFTFDELISKLEKLNGKSLGDLNLSEKSIDKKGSLGLLVEETLLGYNVGPRSSADILHLGIEIKVTPVIKKSKGFISKERLVLNIINYCDENWDDFFESSLWRKNQKLLITFYESKEGVNRSDFKILASIIYSFPEIDLRIIINDWSKIASKVKSGLAHELSESDGIFLGACTKGANSLTVRNQPFSSIMAKQRAYSLKQSYMTSVFNDYVLGNKADERIIRDINALNSLTLEEYIVTKIKPYYGMTQSELIIKFNLQKSRSSKAINSLIIQRILGVSIDIEKTDEFRKAAIKPKTVRIEHDGLIKEHMSFPTFRFCEIVVQSWEESDLIQLLTETRFMFIIFTGVKGKKDYTLSNIRFWSISESEKSECQRVWEKTVNVLNKGLEIIEVNGRIITNLPKSSESEVMHVRPHATNRDDTYPLPDGRELTKQCFWFNRNFVLKIVKPIKFE